MPQTQTKVGELEGRIFKLYQIKENELFLDSLLMPSTQVAESEATIPWNGFSTNLEVSNRSDKVGAKPKLIISSTPGVPQREPWSVTWEK